MCKSLFLHPETMKQAGELTECNPFLCTKSTLINVPYPLLPPSLSLSPPAPASQSSGPYLLLASRPSGLTAQLLALLRAMWVAKATHSVLLLPPLRVTYEDRPAQQASLAKYYDVQHLMAQVGRSPTDSCLPVGGESQGLLLL